jgi:Protein of Unknown function (DUF2784)
MVQTLSRGLADAVVAVHYAYMAYLVVGGFIAWRWRWTIWTHALAVAWAIAIIATKVPCPLTALQNHFRQSAGERPLSDSFIDLYIRGTFYPADHQTIARVVLAAVVLLSWIGFVRVQQHRMHDGVARTPSALSPP